MQQTPAGPKNSKDSCESAPSAVEPGSLYRSLKQELWASFFTFCGDRDLAADALQEAFLRLQQQDLNTVRYPRAWLLRVGRNWLRDVARLKGSKTRPQTLLSKVPTPGESPGMAAIRSEKCEIVRSVLDRVSEADRLILTMCYGLQWPAKRISRALEATPEAVDMRLSRARKRFGRILADRYPEIAGEAYLRPSA